MPPYGLYSLANTPEELLNRGYGYATDIPVMDLSEAERNIIFTQNDPAFGNLNTDIGYFGAPFTGTRPFQNALFLRGDRQYGLGFDADINNPSFGGVSGYRDTGGIMGIEPAARKTSTFVEDDDLEASALSEFAEGELKQPFGLQTLISYLPFGSNSFLGKIGQGISNALQGSRFYRPATIGVGGYTPAQLNQMNALGGFYSEPMRQFRRRSNRISNMLQRAAEGKNYSEKNLQRLMNQFDMGDTDTRGMIDSIKASADMGYGRGGGRDFDSGRDYSSSPGAIAGDMEYGEE